MESLQLPQDLYWDGKMEPSSPSSEIFSLTNSEEFWLFEDNFAKDVLLENEKIEIDEKSDIIMPNDEELLYEFEFDVKQEQWIDGKSDGLPLVEYAVDIPPQQLPTQIVKVQNPYEIIMELEKIYGTAELTQLTPPQTPPQTPDGKEIYNLIGQSIQCSEMVNDNNNIIGNNNNNNTNLVRSLDVAPVLSPVSSNADYSSDSPGSPMSTDIARDIQLVDEILRTRAQDLPDWTDDESSVYSMSSSSQSQSNDDDWSPESSSCTSSPGKIKQSNSSSKRRSRPYGRGVEEKKFRKKEQNKNAATRYRQKKKQEMEEILEEERILAEKNSELQKKVNEIQREVKYLKQLIKEFHGKKTSSK